ncbi:hypothetical protein C4565_00700 [Candidatus Parcubacteria bacterium]|nr:MAG: hypothetical protein C4565_00700 [Candidatus Parcubacteria bacterium]
MTLYRDKTKAEKAAEIRNGKTTPAWFVEEHQNGYRIVFNGVKQYYENGVCPDCQESIPKYAVDGDSCRACGHAFFEPREVDDMEKV